MSTSNPKTGSPLHGKRVYAFIGQTGETLDFVSFATEFSVNLTPQNTARAVVLGTDAVPDVEVHGLIARIRLNLLLTSSEFEFLLALGGVSPDEGDVKEEVDYSAAVTNYLNELEFLSASRLDMIISPLDSAPDLAEDTSILDTDITGKPGYTIDVNNAAITALEITGRVGEYTEARLEVESGRFKINAVQPTE